MGLLDRLFKGDKKDVFGMPEGDAVLPEHLDFSMFKQQQEGSPKPQKRGWFDSHHENPEYLVKTQETDIPYFHEVLLRNFGMYDIRENVLPEEFGGTGDPYSFGLYNGDECVATIMAVGNNGTTRKAYKESRSAAEAAGVPFIVFYMYMPNVEGFVVDRIKRLAKL